MRTIGRYELLGPLGSGAAGRVFRGRDPELSREVAIKLLREPLSEQARSRLDREVEALCRLQHPNVVRIHDSGQHQGQPFLVLELIEGETLQASLDRSGPMDPAEAMDMVRRLALAMAAAHREQILHRDIKPENVLIDEHGQPRLIDFGLALDLTRETRLSKTGGMVGTPGFAAPEQVTGQRDKIGPTTDVYGLGALLYAALTGFPPVEGGSVLEVARRTLEERPEAPRARRAEVSESLSQTCLRCLEKKPERRFSSAAELAQALSGDPAALPSKGKRTGGMIAAGLVVVAALLAGTIVLSARPVEGVSELPPATTQAGPAPRLEESGELGPLWRLDVGQRLSYRIKWTEDVKRVGVDGQSASFSLRLDWEVVKASPELVLLRGVCADGAGSLAWFTGGTWEFPVAGDSPLNVILLINGARIMMALDPRDGAVRQVAGLDQVRAKVHEAIADDAFSSPIYGFSKAMSNVFFANAIHVMSNVTGPAGLVADEDTWTVPSFGGLQRRCRLVEPGRVEFRIDGGRPGQDPLQPLISSHSLGADIQLGRGELKGWSRFRDGRLQQARVEQVSLDIPEADVRITWTYELLE